MKGWSGLAGSRSTSPVVKYLLLGVAVAVVAAVGLAVFYSPWSSKAPPAPRGSETPSGSPHASPRGSGPASEGGWFALPLVARSAVTPSAAPSATSEPLPTGTPTLPSRTAASAEGTAMPTSTKPTTPTKPPTPTPTPTPTPVDFEAVRQQLQAEGKALAHVKIGFHLGPGGNARGLGDYLTGLADAGVPAVIKSADAYGVCAEALRASPNHVTVFRMSGGDLELPNYDLPPEAAAEEHWARIVEALPPEFDKRTWIEVMNEPDKERADWLGRCSHRLAELALRDGYRFAAFGWSSGEPEPEHWRTPGIRAFLSLAAQHPDRIAVALHEYSYSVDDIANQYPSLVGRFQTLFQICDELGIKRPTVLITEWGWESTKVPPVEEAMEDIAWASRLYGAYPNVRGAALWYLGPGYADIADRAQRLIAPLRYYAWGDYFVIEPDQTPTDPRLFAPD